MPEQNDNEKEETTDETAERGTITIAEREGSEEGETAAKPTITIAERDGGE